MQPLLFLSITCTCQQIVDKSVFIPSVRVNTFCVKSISGNQLCIFSFVCLVYYMVNWLSCAGGYSDKIKEHAHGAK